MNFSQRKKIGGGHLQHRKKSSVSFPRHLHFKTAVDAIFNHAF